jgi:hypothetical protein
MAMAMASPQPLRVPRDIPGSNRFMYPVKNERAVQVNELEMIAANLFVYGSGFQ